MTVIATRSNTETGWERAESLGRYDTLFNFSRRKNIPYEKNLQQTG